MGATMVLSLVAFAVVTAPPAPAFLGKNGIIVFASGGDIYRITASGSITHLTEGGANDRDPAVSPDGTQIVFTSDRAGTDGLWIMTTAGQGIHGFPDDTDAGDSEAAWSPDGQRIVFVRAKQLFTADADGSDRDYITNGYLPTWSPDGRHIAFVDDRAVDGGDDVYTIEPDGSGVLRHTFESHDESYPFWRPNEPDEIYYVSFESSPGEPGQMRFVSLSGGTYGPLARISDGTALWSPAVGLGGTGLGLWLLGDDIIKGKFAGGSTVILTEGAYAGIDGFDWQPVCTKRGGPGDNVIRGTADADLICGGDGDDVVKAGGGADVVFGEGGADALRGAKGRDVLVGGLGADALYGDDQADLLAAVDNRRDVVDGGATKDDVCLTDPATDRVFGCP